MGMLVRYRVVGVFGAVIYHYIGVLLMAIGFASYIL